MCGGCLIRLGLQTEPQTQCKPKAEPEPEAKAKAEAETATSDNPQVYDLWPKTSKRKLLPSAPGKDKLQVRGEASLRHQLVPPSWADNWWNIGRALATNWWNLNG